MCEIMDLFPDESRVTKDVIKDGYSLLPNAPDIQVVTLISATKYEKNECKDKVLVFIPSFENKGGSTNNVSANIVLDPTSNIEFSLDNVRLLRKMLQPVDNSHCLVLGQTNNDTYKVVGIGQLNKITSSYQCYAFYLKKHMNWYLKIGGVNALGYDNGEFKRASEIENEIKIEDVLKKIKTKLPNIDETTFKKLIETIVTQKHGTSFVVFADAKKALSEAQRLASNNTGRGFLLHKALRFSKDKINQITDIDGGLIFDLKAQCYAYGCIFDGKVPTNFKGNTGRGARYNSIKLYVEITQNCVGVICSDDGGVDVVQ